jgi:hypothetical protein
METSNTLKESFINKQNILENTKKVLKQEFFGINHIIDEVIDNVSSWYFLPELQEKPIIINLWGLTGVGKTSLINRMVELINFQNTFYRFDLGEKEGTFSFRDSLSNLCENNDSSPIIIALDEFQHTRTVIGPFQEEVDIDKNRMIWELIDSGKIHYFNWSRGLWSFEEMINKLVNLTIAGVEVEKGVVVKNVELYCSEMKIEYKKGKKIYFVPQDEYETILEFSGNMIGLKLEKDVEQTLLSYNAKDTLIFLNRVLALGKKPSVKSFSKALIFILGNLDEAYPMSNNFSADIEADEFYRLSQKITIPQIKTALKKRFRNEQIARLGNIHIIYPALNKYSYQSIIKQELNKYAENLSNTLQINFVFDQSIHEIIYKEGVYPTQGVRPIFTSIQQILKSKISYFFAIIFNKSLNIDCLSFSFDDQKLICNYIKNQEIIYTTDCSVIISLENARKSMKDDIQAITAVHESGHAVLSMLLLKTIPEIIYSTTSDVDNQGFTYSKFAWKYVSRKEIIPRVALFLGGCVAEELIFGKENVTSGSSSDIEHATEFLTEMYKLNGMGQTPIRYSLTVEKSDYTYQKISQIEKNVKAAIEEAKILAENTLKNEKKLLLKLSDYLSEHSFMKKEQIKEFAQNYSTSKIDFIENGDFLYYREHLKSQVENLAPKPALLPHFESVIFMNKDE